MKGCNCSKCGKRQKVLLEIPSKIATKCTKCFRQLLIKRDRDGIMVKTQTVYREKSVSVPDEEECACSNCGKRQDVKLKVSDKKITKCPKCGRLLAVMRDESGIMVKAYEPDAVNSAGYSIA